MSPGFTPQHIVTRLTLFAIYASSFVLLLLARNTIVRCLFTRTETLLPVSSSNLSRTPLHVPTQLVRLTSYNYMHLKNNNLTNSILSELSLCSFILASTVYRHGGQMRSALDTMQSQKQASCTFFPNNWFLCHAFIVTLSMLFQFE